MTFLLANAAALSDPAVPVAIGALLLLLVGDLMSAPRLAPPKESESKEAGVAGRIGRAR